MKNKNFNIRILALFIVSIVLFNSCSKQDSQIQSEKDNVLEPLSGEEINAKIHLIIEKTGTFRWTDVDDYTLWSAVMRGDSILTVGFGAESFSELKSTQIKAQKDDIINLVTSIEQCKSGNFKSASNVLLYEAPILNYIDLRVGNIETITKLRSLKNIRYLDASGYRFYSYEQRLKSSSGCNTSPDAINSGDVSTIAPNCMVSWNYYKHNIVQAWNYSTGKNITVGLIDTGISSEQPLLGSSFNDGYSSGRTVSKYGTYVNSIWPWKTSPTDGVNDKCGHGNRMAATIAGPRNDNNMPVGIAYNCNLISYRATSDVLLNDIHEQRGVANALTALANNTSVKIISMSIGHIITIGSIEDAVKYAYSKNKLIIAAGGTSFDWTSGFVGVIFPARMSECVAVTGITDAAGYHACSTCHKGSQIEFTVIMERNGTGRHAVGLGFQANTKQYTGGSSIATSTTAGIAALVWGAHPTWTRSQVLQKMRQSASLYPNRDGNYGYGNINALLAVQ